jgi:D-proline reductase (dithiol) PrdB
VCLTARTLEAGGIATVVIGSALDITEHCGTPRFIFNDLPLGNPLGKPFDQSMQRKSVDLALNLADTASAPGITISTDFRWSDNEDWKENYARVDDSNKQALLQLGEENRKQRALNRSRGITRK